MEIHQFVKALFKKRGLDPQVRSDKSISFPLTFLGCVGSKDNFFGLGAFCGDHIHIICWEHH
jgi:hypothetical protein